MEIRNIAIIAHVDHGKTTLTDALMRQTGAVEGTVSMDSNSLEQERGITIYAKNASVEYKGTKLNIVDTPGHADFGSEVERVLRSIDSVLLVVDAQEGPMPQTRFVLKKSLELGLKPIVIINKIDKPAADPNRCEDQVLELFMELGANDEQTNFKVVYAIGRDGVAKKKLDDEFKDLTPLLDTIIETVPPAKGYGEGDALKAQVFNLGYDDYTGRLAVARIYEGRILDSSQIFIKEADGTTRKGKITKLSTFKGLEQIPTKEAFAGDIVLIAGFADIDIGETLTDDENAEPLPAIAVDEPTIGLQFMPNSSPFVGREGKLLTSREIKARLEKELEINVGLQVDFSEGSVFKVYGRGEMHVAILLENMRREGFEVMVSQPQVIIREIDGKKHEPFEEVTVDIPSEFQGIVIERISSRAFIMQNMITHENQVRLIFEGPTRGLLGYRGQFTIDTKGEGILCSQVLGFRPHAGEIKKRYAGSMTSMVTGKAVAFALWNLQERGEIYIGHATEVYEGMVIGNTSKGDEMVVNPTKGKQLTNIRAAGSEEAITLIPHQAVTIEGGLEIMQADEYLEVTPKSVRLRKQFLKEGDRIKKNRT
ncbi:MAG: translational GTPase TypA [Candidatus Paceibacterota bacterium]